MAFQLGHLVDLTKAQQDIAVNELRKGGLALVIGHASTRQWGALGTHPRVIVWTDDDLRRRPTVPANVRIVVMARQIGHQYADPIIKQCARRGVRLFKFADTVRQAVTLLEPALNAMPDSVPQKKKEDAVVELPTINVAAAARAAEERRAEAPESKPVQAPPAKVRRGALIDYLRRRPDLDAILSQPRSEVSARILTEVRTAVPTTTRDSIANCLWRLAQERGAPKARQRRAVPPVKTVFSATAQPEAKLVKVSPTGPVERRAEDDDVARLLIDAIESCQLALESYRAELAKGEDRVRERVRAALKDFLG